MNNIKKNIESRSARRTSIFHLTLRRLPYVRKKFNIIYFWGNKSGIPYISF